MLDSINKDIRLIAYVIEIDKDNKGHVGIAIGGGAPYCPNLYVVQIFENSPVKKKGLLNVGDEIVAVNGRSVKGFEKTAVASMIRESGDSIRISFNRLHFEPESQSLDILLKKFKHRLIDSMDDTTADALGLSRAILCNDVLALLQTKLDKNQQFYRTLTRKAEEMLRCYQQISSTHTSIGASIAEIVTREAIEESHAKVFTELANIHKIFGSEHTTLAHKIGEMICALHCHANAAIPDAKQTLSKYLDAKYEYLSYCLRVKEMEDEEAEMGSSGEHLPRMESGNYEYRMALKSREHSRDNFMDRRRQIAVKIELLDEKHVRELALQLKNFINSMKAAHTTIMDGMNNHVD